MATEQLSEQELFERAYSALESINVFVVRGMRQGEAYTDRRISLCWQIWQTARKEPMSEPAHDDQFGKGEEIRY